MALNTLGFMVLCLFKLRTLISTRKSRVVQSQLTYYTSTLCMSLGQFRFSVIILTLLRCTSKSYRIRYPDPVRDAVFWF